MLEGNSKSISFENFSDGYRIIATLGLCLLHGLRSIKNNNNLFMSGIALIDEIDIHLHPQWRLKILKTFSNLFPNVQFIFTTHDPIVLRSMNAKNVKRLEHSDRNSRVSGKRKSSLVFKSIPGNNLSGYQVDDLLISEIFNLKSTRSSEEHQGFGQYLRLLHEKNRLKNKSSDLDNSQKIRLNNLRKRYGGGHAGFSHPRDILLIPAIDQFTSRLALLSR